MLEEVENVSQERVMEEEQAKISDTNSGETQPFGGGGGQCGLGRRDLGDHRRKQGREARLGEGWTWPCPTLLNLPLNVTECLA